jgi:branched-chain amino acid transport system substrate-binding protein
MWTAVINYLNSVRPDNPTDKIAIVYDEGDWGSAAVTNWRNNAEEWGYDIVVDEAVSESTTDMSTLVSKIKAADADLVITAVFTSATNLLAKTLHDYQCSAVIAGLGGGVGDTTFIEEAGDAAEGVLYTAPWVPSWGGGSDEVNALAAEFAQEYGYEMTMEPAWGWLALATVIEAVENAGSADREAVADALYATDISSDSWVMMFSGYDGISFCTEGQSSEKYGSTSGERYNQNTALGDTSGMILIQVQNGAWTAVYPTDYTGGQDVIIYN